MKKHPFRIAIETQSSREDFAKLFAPDVVLMAPMLTKPVVGAAQALNVIEYAAKIAGPIQYTQEVSDPRQTFLFWNGQAGGFKVEAATILVDGEDGLIHEVRVLMRPWPVVTLFSEGMYRELSNTIPPDYWELGPKPAKTGELRRFTSIALRPIEMSPDVVLHSPILAKSVSGKTQVEEAIKLAHHVQSASSYTSIIAIPNVLIELFDCDADEFPMEGIWMQKLNEKGQIYDLTVFLRPYPAVSVLRNKTRQLAGEGSVLTDDYWELPNHV
jgi:hypothetical protein